MNTASTIVLAAAMVLLPIYVLRGVRRRDPPLKIFDDALLVIGLPLFVALRQVVPGLRVPLSIAMLVVCFALFWRVVRPQRR
jgi:hypothetical protein